MLARTEGLRLTEQRQHERVPCRLRCWCEGENVTVYARIANLSEGGMFLMTSIPLTHGERARLRFGLGTALEMETSAEVVWTHAGDEQGPPGMGLRFQEMDQDKLVKIRQIIQNERPVRRQHDS